jgi:DNA polymerase III alpha subunit
MSQKSNDFIQTRSFLAANIENILENVSQRREANKIDADDIFGGGESHAASEMKIIKKYIPKSKLQVLLEEKESLGLYVSGNPLAEYEDLLEWIRNTILRDDVHLVVINKIKKMFTKKNLMMFALQVSTPQSDIEAIIFPKKAMEFSPILVEKELFWVKGKIDKKETDTTVKTNEEGDINEYEERPKILIEEIVPFETGVMALFKEGDKVPLKLTEQRKELMKTLDFVVLRDQPHFISGEEIESRSKHEIGNKDLTPRLLKLPMSLGIENITIIKQSLSKEVKPGQISVQLEVESSQGWKKVKDIFWLPQEIYSRFSS